MIFDLKIFIKGKESNIRGMKFEKKVMNFLVEYSLNNFCRHPHIKAEFPERGIA